MSFNDMIENENTQYAQSRAVLGSEFKWLSIEQLNITAGLINVVRKFLWDIEVIYGDTPDLSFLRIIAEPFDFDLDYCYRRKVKVFIQMQSTDKDQDAKQEALSYATDECRALSKQICCDCGFALVNQHIDVEAIVKAPYLALFDKMHSYNSIPVCTQCAEIEWRESEANTSASNEADKAKNEAKEISDNKGKKEVPFDPLNPFSEYKDDDELDSNTENDEERREHFCDQNDQLILNASLSELKTVQFYAQADVDKMDKSYQEASRDSSRRMRGVINKINAAPIDRRLVKIPENWREFFTELEQNFPNFVDVIQLIKYQCALSVYGDVVNPMFMLDELDKVCSDGIYNPLSALHRLLEPEQAACFHDLSVPELSFDVSHVIWVATGNDIDSIEEPLLDRFAVFTIEIPT